MKCKSSPFLIFFLVFVGCSPSALRVERAVAPGTLTVIQLSDSGAIEQTLDQLPLTETIAGPSDIVVRDGYVYIASYKQFLIAEAAIMASCVCCPRFHSPVTRLTLPCTQRMQLPTSPIRKAYWLWISVTQPSRNRSHI